MATRVDNLVEEWESTVLTMIEEGEDAETAIANVMHEIRSDHESVERDVEDVFRTIFLYGAEPDDNDCYCEHGMDITAGPCEFCEEELA